MRQAAWSLLVVSLVGCAEDRREAMASDAWVPSGSSDSSTSTSEGTEVGSSTGADDRGEFTATDPGDASSSSTEESSGGEPAFDCAPLWTSAWIGSPCARDDECAYDGGFCLREDQGFPCGTCSQACDNLCPDLEGAPVTFCIDGAAVGLASGHCLSKCDSGLLGGNGCRDGYGCTTLGRFREPNTTSAVCVPEAFTEPETDCAAALDQLGAAWEPAQYTPESPDGYPELLCTIDEPVRLYEPIPGMTLRYVSSDAPGNVLVSCRTALAIAHSSQVAADLGAVEFVHYGTYNCRPISGTSTLSQHSFAAAIDVYGFTLEDGTLYSVLDHWEDFVEVPTTPGGIWLRDFADAIWDMGFWTIILSPEYNDDHDNHLHVDNTVDGHYYYWE